MYLRIPGARSGKGKITVTVQGREVQFAAVTDAEDVLPTGSDVEIVEQVTADTFIVRPL